MRPGSRTRRRGTTSAASMPELGVSPDGSPAPIRLGARRRRPGFERALPAGAPVYGRALADTGALLAYLDAVDRWHERCRLAFEQLRLPLTTSTAVLTELFHLVGDSPRELDITWKFVRSGAITLAPISDRDLPDIEALMRKYHNRPMDYADATLVHLAQRETLSTVFTIDHDDFETYRVGGRKRLRIVPPRQNRPT
jgi:predicted nucleic acid-binding protein